MRDLCSGTGRLASQLEASRYVGGTGATMQLWPLDGGQCVRFWVAACSCTCLGASACPGHHSGSQSVLARVSALDTVIFPGPSRHPFALSCPSHPPGVDGLHNERPARQSCGVHFAHYTLVLTSPLACTASYLSGLLGATAAISQHTRPRKATQLTATRVSSLLGIPS